MTAPADHFVLPNLVLVGVAKAGTTSLFTYLAQHPDVCASSVKEVSYYAPLRYGEPVVAPLGEYARYFAHCAGRRVRMEASAGYFYGGRNTAEAVKRDLPDARIVVVLREPVARLVSYYRFKQSRLELPDDLTIDDYADTCLSMTDEMLAPREANPFFGVRGGEYDRFMPAWRDVFGPDLRVVFFEDLTADPRQTVQSIATWLGLDIAPFAALDTSVENKTTHFKSGLVQRTALTLNDKAEPFFRRHPSVKRRLRSVYYKVNGRSSVGTLSPEIAKRLYEHFRPHNERLSRQLREMGVVQVPAWLAEDCA